MGPEPGCGRLDQRAARLAAGGGNDLRAEPVQRRPDRPFEELERDVPREPVADDDVGRVREQPAALDVALETEVAGREQLVRLEGELVPFLGLLADRQEADRRAWDVEGLLGEDRAHQSELE